MTLHSRLVARVARVCFTTVLIPVFSSVIHAETIPKDRPRSRPPSALTGWADWESGEELLKRLKVPPAPVRSPAEEMATFKLAPGYRIELVAAEPLVQNPIFFEFDPDGRIWVVEYQGYMRDLEGTGEGDAICRVVVLEDTDADGRADKSTVFLDKLVMPRSLAFVKGGVLVHEPPTLWYCEDTDGDLRADRKTKVGEMGVAGNPQHTANGLRYGLDNWLHNADWPKRHRWQDAKLIEQDTIHRGQFGVTFDEAGRFFTCYENKALHGDSIPAEYLLRNRNLFKLYQRGGGDRSAFGVNVDLATRAQEIFPIRVTPAVTLGALELRDDGRLRTYTIVSGVCYYDGHQFPADARGNVFVPESGGHLVGRLVLPTGIAPQATRFYPPEQEFLASTDERFRPVNARVGPDGALYLADMYHGIIEHVIFMVPWLTKQIQERRLDQGNDLGRIWRIVAENQPLDRRAPKLSNATSAELIKTLAHPNGWHRLTAQRLLAERNDTNSVPALRKLARGNTGENNKPADTNAPGQLHALWTLDGLESLDLDTTLAALDSSDERVRAAAVRLSERHAGSAALTALARRIPDPSQAVRLQLALTLGVTRDPQVPGLLAQLLARDDDPLFRTAAVSGLAGRELEFLRELFAALPGNTSNPQDGFELLAASESTAHCRQLTALLARCVLEEMRAPRVGALFELFAHAQSDVAWKREGLIEAFTTVRYSMPLPLAKEPQAFTALLRSDDSRVRDTARRALNHFTWPGDKETRTLTPDTDPLTPAQQQLVETGRETYTMICASCHQPHGGGSGGVAPPLAGSDWVDGPPERLARVVLHGLYGPVEVNGQRWNLHMPGFGTLDLMTDERIAGVLSYVRRAWGNAAPPVEPALIRSVRTETVGRTFPWRAEELGFPKLAEANDTVVKPAANGNLELPARLATTYGQRLAYRPSLDILAPWQVKDDVAGWSVEVPAGGAYEVRVTLAADDASAGDRFRVETEGSHTIGTVLSSGGYDRFRDVPAGQLALRAGVNRILMRVEGDLRQELADVRALRLIPVNEATKTRP